MAPEELPVLLELPRNTPRDVAIADEFIHATRISGIVLALASLTELIMANIIADYFSENLEKRNQMFSSISESLSLDQKRRMLMRVLGEKSFEHLTGE